MADDEMTPKERFHAALRQEPVDRIPITGITQTGTVDLMEACGAYWPEANQKAEGMVKLAWAAYEVAGIESVRVPFDVYIEGEAAGGELYKWKKDNQPMMKKYAIETPEDVDKYEPPDPKRDGRMPEVLKAIEMLVPKAEKVNIPIISPVFAPFSLISLSLVNMVNVMMWLKTDPDLYHKLAKKAVETGVIYAEALIDAGADTIFYNGGADGTVKLDDFLKISQPYSSEGAKKIREMGAYVVYHSCANVKHLLKDMADIEGIHCISVSQEVDMKESRELVGDKVALAGNVDPTYTLVKGTPEKVKEEAKYCIESGTDVLCPGCGWGPTTPLENMKALVAAGHEFGKMARLARK
ncbi:MAG TPA: MtaA/CmuA family methyltransferase [Candidatus Syntrophoarchaeum butanivorans]|uniref:Methylcobamide:CoM methyltransferase n=1 Tax=Candidatus Syntropharchaeum butanivorans TaxID=1839936 RepID=A0A1F2P3K0_9EURY|nr:MAG: methylcobamide:CoM methyltransferase [Candidatus Syntrophoarchaeum butanivorans]HEC56289.1 MtaA/CmuA family methyltransferase [Candidatus Syntrophoarchaeum butanivorans]